MSKMFKIFLLSAFVCTLVLPLQAAPQKTASGATVKKKVVKKPRKRVRRPPQVFYNAKFTKGGWKAADWEMVRSWRFNYDGQWIQKDKCIENKVPADATPREMLGRRAGETYTAMLLKKKFKGNTVTTCTMEFDDRMAPGIIISTDPVKGASGKLEFREHFEVILYDNGLNVWHHYFENGKQVWRKQHFLNEVKCYKPKKPYTLKVSIQYTKKGPMINLIYGKRTIGYYEPKMFKGEYRIGLVGCEGVNRFYDFKVTSR